MEKMMMQASSRETKADPSLLLSQCLVFTSSQVLLLALVTARLLTRTVTEFLWTLAELIVSFPSPHIS